MTNKKVSIVLPVYNGAKYIQSSIESVINQTYKNWELIIVDDCSTDNTSAIIHKISMQDERIFIYKNEENLKLPLTLNVGFEHATGEYYTWTSDDNMYEPNAIETMITELEANPLAVMVYADYINIDDNGMELGAVSLPNPELIVTGNVCGACFLYTAQAAKMVGGYDARLFLAEDYDYWLQIARYGAIHHIKKILYKYRRHPDSLTATKKEKIQFQTYRALEKNFLFLYTMARQQNLQYQFFDYMLHLIPENYQQLRATLTMIDWRYNLYQAKKFICTYLQKAHL